MKQFIVVYKVFDVLSNTFLDTYSYIVTSDIYDAIGRLALHLTKPAKDFKYYEVI